MPENPKAATEETRTAQAEADQTNAEQREQENWVNADSSPEEQKKTNEGRRGEFVKEDPRIAMEIEKFNHDGPMEDPALKASKFQTVTRVLHDGKEIPPRTEVSQSDFGDEDTWKARLEDGSVQPVVDEDSDENEVWVNYVPADNRPAPLDPNEPAGGAQVRYATLENFPQPTNVPEESDNPNAPRTGAHAPAGAEAPQAHVAGPAKVGDTTAAKPAK